VQEQIGSRKNFGRIGGTSGGGDRDTDQSMLLDVEWTWVQRETVTKDRDRTCREDPGEELAHGIRGQVDKEDREGACGRTIGVVLLDDGTNGAEEGGDDPETESD